MNSISSNKQQTLSSVKRQAWGKLSDGREVTCWKLRNSNGMQVEILSLGCAIRSISVPDRDSSKRSELVLGFNTIEEYELKNPSFFGVIAGPIAGRLPGGSFDIDDKTYQLEQNDGTNHLHGGSNGLDKRLWDGEGYRSEDSSVGVCLRYHRRDGDQGYPGNLDIMITYTLTPDNQLIFTTDAQTDKRTPLTIAQHSYFNLSGAGNRAIEHIVQVDAAQIAVTDEEMNHLGELSSVDGRAADFRQPTLLSNSLPDLWQQHGDLYKFRSDRDVDQSIASAHCPVNDRRLVVRTTHPFMQFYTSAHLDGTEIGAQQLPYDKHAALCFECQGYPDPNSKFSDIWVRPDQVQHHQTSYQFFF